MWTRSPPPSSGSPASRSARFGIARVMSKAGLCSRSSAEEMVRAGRVELDGRLILDPEYPIAEHQRQRVCIDGTPLSQAVRVYVMLNKPRGAIVSTHDERERDTIYRCFDGADLPWLAAVGRLDRASEGLLLLSNDPGWAARITDPISRLPKTYRVQVARVPTTDDLAALRGGIEDAGETLLAQSSEVLRSGGKTAWIEIVLHAGRNRQIRRMLAARNLTVLRLIRVAIGRLALGELPKGAWRSLEPQEIEALALPTLW